MKKVALLLILSSNALLAAEPANDSVWPRWRGPNDNGVAVSGTYPSVWNDGRNLRWKVKLSGLGCSTPVVWNEKILLTAPLDGQDAVACYNWQGQSQWQTAVGKERAGKHRNGSGCNPSPVTDGQFVFAYFKSGNLAGLDLNGKLLWKRNLQDEFAKDTLFWDVGTSPVLIDKAVVVAVMHAGESYLAAFDKKSGELLWKVARNYKTPVEGDHGYTTPTVIQHNGAPAILVWGGEHVTAHAASDGHELWNCGGFNPDRKANWVAVASAVVAQDVVIVPYGRGTHLAAVKLNGTGDVTETHRLWTRRDTGAFVPTPVVSAGKIYLVRDEGEVECLALDSGKTLWSDRFPKNRNKYYGSPMIADGKMFVPREDGIVMVARIGDKFELLNENDMGERVIASPVPVAGRLLIRGEQHLFCIGESAK